MVKYSFLVYHKDLQEFTNNLMDMGLVHIVEKEKAPSQQVTELREELKTLKHVLKRLEQRKVKTLKSRAEIQKGEVPKLETFAEKEKQLEKLTHSRDVLLAEINLLEPWVEVPWASLKKLEQEAGIIVRFFDYPARKFDKTWEQDYAVEIIRQQNGRVYFIQFHQQGDEVLPLVPLVLPKKSLNSLREDLQEVEKEINMLNKTLDEHARDFTKYLKSRIVLVNDQLELKVAEEQIESTADDHLKVLEAWCPETVKDSLEKFLNEKKIVFVEDTSGEEVPPVLLKNNKFSKLFEPIGRMFSLPAYSELDLTVFFAPFFLLFFGFCLGDAGYGVVMFIAATLIKPRFKGNDEMRAIATLGQLFGISTTVIGFLSGTLFGLEMAKLPQFEAFKGLFISQDKMFFVALGIGFLQIIFGMCVQVYKQVKFQGWLFALNRIGWIIGLIALLDITLFEVAKPISTIALIIGGALVVLFGSPKDGPLKSIGLGLADLYNITGVAGDLLSYIRLFALGVSSAILGLVVNSIALSAKGVPYIGIILTILILVIGHAANLMLASLSAFVHPMRLTFVEFYKNVGFIGGGKPFKKFHKKYNPVKSKQE